MIDERDIWKYTWSGVAWARVFAMARRLRRRALTMAGSDLHRTASWLESAGAR